MYVSREGKPYLTYTIIAVSALIMLQSVLLSPSVLDTLYNEYALNPSYIVHGLRLISIVSYMFLNANWVHLLVNCFVLWGVGTVIEKEIGSTKFGIVFLASGIVAGLSYVFLNDPSTMPLVGASGAIFGVLAVLFLLTPFKKTQLFLAPLPALLIGILMISVEMAALIWSKDPWIAHDAHIAGFVTGGVASFWIDQKRALKGLAIGAGIVIVVYLLGVFLGFI